MTNTIQNIDKSKKDMAIAFEIVFGLFLVFGVGWIYAGNKVRGIILLIGSLLALSSTLAVVASTGGLGVCCCIAPIYLSLIADILSLRRWLENPFEEDIFGMIKKGCALYVVGIILILIALLILIPRLPLIFKVFGK